MSTFLEMMSYPFMLRALVVGVLLSAASSMLGVTLVLKRYAMIGDGLSHVAFGALALAVCFQMTPLWVAIPIVIMAAVILLRLSEKSKIKGDAAIALISTGALAIGVVLVSLSTGMNMDVYNYMFGSILAMSKEDVVISIVVAVSVFVIYIFSYSKIFAVTFDEDFAKAIGVRVGFYQMLLAVLTALVIVIGMRLMGAMLISSLIVFPAITAMRVCKHFKTVVLCSVGVSVVGFLSGILFSYFYAVPAGASVVIADILLFLIFSMVRKILGY